MKSYGLMGGTFDPIHLGHLRAAENAREALGLDRVVFVPSGIPPHRGGTAAPAHDRLLMAELATSAHPHFTCSDVELTRAGRSYTVDTLEQLRAAEPGIAWTLVVGADAYAEIGSWREPERILALCRLAVVERPGSGETPAGPPAVRVPTTGLSISSTTIRRQIKEGRSVRYLVPEAVADYIAKRGLYR